MAAVNKVFQDGEGTAIIRCTNDDVGVGGEAAVLKVDISTLFKAPTVVAIEKIWYDCDGVAVHILFDATADQLAWICAIGQSEHDFGPAGHIRPDDPAAAGFTGDILFTTKGHAAGDSYAIMLRLRKIKFT